MPKASLYTLSKLQQFQANIFDQNLTPTKRVATIKLTTDYPFVTLIRFVSMIGIVWAHIVIFTGYQTERVFFNTVGHVELYIAFMQIFKFGVICFFIISGFLLGDKIKTESLTQYYKRRLESTLKPYLVVLLIFIGILSYRVFIVKHDIAEEHSSFLKIINFSVFGTHLWYLPNYLIALAVILIFFRFTTSKISGRILFLITLLYTIFTVYSVNYQAPHASALFAYVFYLWLGIYIRQNVIIIDQIKKLKLIPLVVILITLYGLSCFESYQLYQNNLGYFNILRISNQLYSVAMFAFLIRICNSSPNFGIFNPRKETYGIYLYHGLFAWFALPKIVYYFYNNKIINLRVSSVYGFMCYHILFFVCIYLTTTFLVKILLKYNIGYLQNKASS